MGPEEHPPFRAGRKEEAARRTGERAGGSDTVSSSRGQAGRRPDCAVRKSIKCEEMDLGH